MQGSAEQQLAALRDYLFRLAGSLETVQNAPGVLGSAAVYSANDSGSGSGSSAAAADAIAKMRQNARELKALILKTADEIYSEMDTREESYHGEFLARSEFGEFEESFDLRVETSARNIVEGYDYDSAIRSAQDSADAAQEYYTQISGEIRRGFLDDPDHPGELVFGIAISSALRFTGAARTRDGYEYYELVTGQTFGLYTSTGWQFWINGHKAGWFDSLDGMLHVANVYIEDNLRFGDTWRMRQTGRDELEISYVGVE